MPVQWGGKTWTSWGPFAKWLRERGVDPYKWAVAHPAAAVELGAPYGITHVQNQGQGPILTTTPGVFQYVDPSSGPTVPVIGPGGVIAGRVPQPTYGGGGGGGGGGLPPVMVDVDGDGYPDLSIPGGGMPPGGTGQTTAPNLPGYTDWSQLLGIAGLPADIMAKINEIFRTYADPNQAAAVAIGYVRGTAWYAQTFVGINEGIQRGLFSDERGYRDYRNALEQVYNQWAGRVPSSEELVAALREGVSPDVVGRRFEARAWAEANRADIRFFSGSFGAGHNMFSDADIEALGRERAGLGTPSGIGLKLDKLFQEAQERMRRAFQGVAANPQLALTTRGTLYSASTGQSASVRPDIAA
jgi:hypothetical protein